MKVTKLILFWLFTLLIINSVNSQSYTFLFDSLYYSDGNSLEKQFDALVSSQASQYGKEEAAKMAHDFSVAYYKKGNLSLSLKYGLAEIDLYEQINLKNKAYGKALYQVGFLYQNTGNYNEAISYHERVISYDIDPEYVARSYCKIGSCYDDLGDLYKALDYYTEGIFRLEEQKKYRSLARYYINIAFLHSKIGTEKSLNQVLAYARKAEALQKHVSFPPSRIAALHNILADYYNTISRHDFDSAIYHYNQTLRESLQIHDSIRAHAVFVNLGVLYNKQALDSAEWLLKESLKYPASRSNRVNSYRALSDFYMKKNDAESALKSIDIGISINLWGEKEYVEEPITKASLKNAANPDEALSAIVSKAVILIHQYEKSGEKLLINKALNSLQSADTLVNIIQYESSAELSRLLWQRRASEVYSKGILCSQILQNHDYVFYFSEKIKALLLTENILTKAKNETLPDAIKINESILKGAVIEWQNVLKQSKDNSKTNEIRKKLVSSKLRYQHFIDSLRFIYPGYYSQKSSLELLPLNAIQRQLPDNMVVVSYVWDTDEDEFDNVYGILISKDSSSVFSIHELEKLKITISDFRKMLSKPYDTNSDMVSYRNTSYRLFQSLFPNEEIRKLIKNKKLLILPDNQLHNIPFEALITEKSSNKYLIQESEISYGYSMSFMHHNNSIQRNASNAFIGFSPVNFGYDELTPISWSGFEVDNIEDILDGKVIKDKNATKGNFLNQSLDYEIIHLATHSNAGDDPWIAFSDSKLNIEELYNTKSNADLIFLSSCNTTLGNIAEGEGILNMVRGFFYAGANSVISTLWNINDKSAFFITKEFYHNIDKGHPKSTALRLAKLKYIDTHSLSDASPHYWSSFVLIGDYNSVPTYSEGFSFQTVLLLLVLIVVIIGLFKFLQKNLKLQGNKQK